VPIREPAPPGRIAFVLELFPDTAAVENGVLAVGGVLADELAREHGTPLVVYCERTLRARARAYREAAPDALVVYGTKAFPNVAVLHLLAEEGLGADVSTAGELAFALAAGIDGSRLVVHGNNKSDEELAAAAQVGALVVLDAPDELNRAAAAGVRRALVRITPGIDADTHEAIRTAQLGSKFGLPPEQALAAIADAQASGISIEGLHVHVGSQLLDSGASLMTVDWLGTFAARARADLGWTPATVDLGGGLGIAYTEDDTAPDPRAWVAGLLAELERAWSLHDLPRPRVIFEPGRSVVGPAGFTLYRVGAVKRASEHTTWVAVDGGMSDNPRPILYGARLTALLANRAAEDATGMYGVAGKHCESGDVLIERVSLPEPRRGDLLAVPATGAYTLGMASNYNGVARPAAVLVADGATRLVRRRETVEDLLRYET
jgi:diaminopimelate decarboxylase